MQVRRADGESELVLVDGWVYMKEAMALDLIGK